MGKVLSKFEYGSAGTVSRSIDDIIISVRNAGSADIPFGAPVFLGTDGAVPFNISTPQEFTAFLGFAVRVADKTPDSYPNSQLFSAQEGVWHPDDLMEVLVRGTIVALVAASGSRGGQVYIRKSDGKLTATAGASGSSIALDNVRIRNPKPAGSSGCAEIVINKRNIL